MPHVLGRFKADAAEWKKTVETDKAEHAEAGLVFERVWTNADEPKEIFFLFSTSDLEKSRAFLKKVGALDPKEQKAGNIPVLTFLADA
jgi:hypothetical protein